MTLNTRLKKAWMITRHRRWAAIWVCLAILVTLTAACSSGRNNFSQTDTPAGAVTITDSVSPNSSANGTARANATGVVTTKSTAKLRIITTLFPQYDFTRQIAGERADVRLLLPPGVEAHAYEPTPRDVSDIGKADLFIYTNEVLEPWVARLTGANPQPASVINAGKGIELLATRQDDEGHPPPVPSDAGDGEERDFAWIGLLDLKAGEYRLTFAKRDGNYAGPAMQLVFYKTDQSGKAALTAAEKRIPSLLSAEPQNVDVGDVMAPAARVRMLIFDEDHDESKYALKVSQAGRYILMLQDSPAGYTGARPLLSDSKDQPVTPLEQNPAGALTAPQPTVAPDEPDDEHDHSDHDHSDLDPHIWLDPLLAKQMVQTITDALIAVDPGSAALYQRNSLRLQDDLVRLDEDITRSVAMFKSKTIIYGGHFAFGYYARHYGLHYVSPYIGFSPQAEPTPQRIAELIKLLNNSGVKTVFHEENISPKVAQVIATQTGAKLALLHGAHNLSQQELDSGLTYLQIQRGNLERLTQALSGDG